MYDSLKRHILPHLFLTNISFASSHTKTTDTDRPSIPFIRGDEIGQVLATHGETINSKRKFDLETSQEKHLDAKDNR
jgi:hypothetical protein